MRFPTCIPVLACVAAAPVLTILPAGAQTTTITGTTGGRDSWNTPSNWSSGVPSGATA